MEDTKLKDIRRHFGEMKDEATEEEAQMEAIEAEANALGILAEVYGPDTCPYCYHTDDTHHPSCPAPYGDESDEMDAFAAGELLAETNEVLPRRASSFTVFGYRQRQLSKKNAKLREAYLAKKQ